VKLCNSLLPGSMQTGNCFERSVNIYQSTCCHIQEYQNLHFYIFRVSTTIESRRNNTLNFISVVVIPLFMLIYDCVYFQNKYNFYNTVFTFVISTSFGRFSQHQVASQQHTWISSPSKLKHPPKIWIVIRLMYLLYTSLHTLQIILTFDIFIIIHILVCYSTV
jgi:hypothetical protein